MKINKTLLGCVSGTVLASMSTGVSAAAEDAGATQAAAASTRQIEEIMVTARKREENLQTVPVAITAISAADLQARQITNIEGLQSVTPNLVIQSNTLSAAGANIFIRGLGQGDFDRTFAPAVQILFDDVRYGSGIAGQLVNVVDVESIEVLRGPQGTLFGANAIGGVINIKRPKPRDEFGGQIEATLGDYGQVDVKGSITGPLIKDKLSGRIGVVSLKSDGPFKNEFDGRRRGFENILSISPSLLFKPQENIEILLTYDYMHNKSDWGVLQNRSNKNDLLCMGALTGGVPYCDDPNRDLTVFNQDTRTFMDIESHFASMHINVDLGNVKLTSITGYSKTNENKQTDFDGVPVPVFASIQPVKEKMLSEELRLDWSASDRLKVLLGLFGSHSKYEEGANSLFIFSIFGLGPNTTEVVSRDQVTKTLGAFASADLKLTDDWTLTVGGRYSHEKKDFNYRNGFNQVGGGFWPDAPGFDNFASGSDSWNDFTPKVSVQYTPTKDLLLYASYTKGTKSGGFNGRGNSTDTIGPYNPEKANNYEAGVKSEWANHTIRLNIAGFYTDYKDKQEEIIKTNPATGATITLVDNAASVHINGIEGEFVVMPFDGLTLSGTGAYLHSKYNKFVYGGFDVSNYVDPKNAPKFQFSAAAEYDFTVPNFADFQAFVNYHWTDSYQTSLGPRFDGGGPSPLINDPRAFVHSYGILDASLRATYGLSNKAQGSIMVYVKNATNKVFYESFYPVANLWNMSSVSMPRTWGVQFGVKF